MSKKDPVLRYIGNFGKWQAKNVCIVSLIAVFFTMHLFAGVFLMPRFVSYWCLPEDFPFSPDSATWTSPPMVNDDNKTVPDTCLMYDLEYKDLVEKPNTTGLSTTTCTNWEYDRKQFPESVLSQFDLVCASDYLISLSKSIYMFGLLSGEIVSGQLSDRYGRKLIMLIFSCFSLVFGIAISFSPSMPIFMFLRWCMAFCAVSTYISGFVYCMEIVGGKWTTIVGMCFQIPFSAGIMLLPLASWLFPQWNHLLLAITIPIILFIIPVAVPALIPESPRWMLFHGKAEEAIDMLKSAAKFNKRTVEELEIIEENSTTDQPSASVLDLFRTPRIRMRIIIMWFIFFTCNIVYYGILLNVEDLFPGDPLVNFAIFGALEIPVHIIGIFVLQYIGRRWAQSGTLIISGVFMILSSVLPDEIAKNVCAQIGRLFITSAYDICFIYVVELFPTVIRGVAIGSSSMCARIAAIISPFIGKELKEIFKYAPLIIFGVTPLLVGLLALLLPETNNEVLPDTIEEGERFGKDQSLLPTFCQKTTAKSEDQDRE